MMATQQAFFVNEGEELFANMLFRNDASGRPANLELLLFTDAVVVSESSTYADVAAHEITGGNYARKTLLDANWTKTNGVYSYPAQKFTPQTTGFTGNVQGAAIVTKGSSPKLLFIITDSISPVVIGANSDYNVAFNIACSSDTKGNTELFLDMLLLRDLSKRGTDMKTVLFTNPANINAKVLGDITQPTTAGGYAAIDILDSSWTISNTTGETVAVCPTFTFTPTGTTFSNDIIGYAIVTKNSPNYVVAIETDPTQPVIVPLNTPYIVTPSIKVM